MPSVSGSLIYTGQVQSPVLTEYVAEALTKGGNISETDAGSYTMTLTPTSNYQWSDETSITKNLLWNINKATSSISLDKTSVSLSNSATAAVVTVSGSGDGTLSATSNHPEIATVEIEGNQVIITGMDTGSAVITIKCAESQNYTAAVDKTVEVTSTIVLNYIFGVMKDLQNQSPELTRLNTLNDPNGLVNINITSEPIPAVGTVEGSSPFDAFYPWNKMEEWNVVNGNITVKKGQAGFSRTANDVVVYIPEFYIKVVSDTEAHKRYYYISQGAISGFTKHPGSGRCVGKYLSDENYTSKSGLIPKYTATRSMVRQGHKERGSKFNTCDFASWCAIQWLYLVEYGNYNSQEKIGRGYVEANFVINSGSCDTMIYHTGRAAGTDGKTAVMYRWIENLWGNLANWIDGINTYGNICYVCTDPSKFADDTAIGYTDTGLSLRNATGWIVKHGYSDEVPWAFIPITAGGSETTWVCDHSTAGTSAQTSKWCVFFGSGDGNDGNTAGLFRFYALWHSTDGVLSYSGGRLLYIPTEIEIEKMST